MYNMTRVCNFLYRPPILCNLLMQSKQLVYSAFWWIGSSNWRICCQQILSKRLNNIQFNELFLALPRQLCGRPCYWLTDKNYIIFLGHWKYDTWLHSKVVIKDHDIWPSKNLTWFKGALAGMRGRRNNWMGTFEKVYENFE